MFVYLLRRNSFERTADLEASVNLIEESYGVCDHDRYPTGAILLKTLKEIPAEETAVLHAEFIRAE